MEKVLINLLANASKYSHGGSQTTQTARISYSILERLSPLRPSFVNKKQGTDIDTVPCLSNSLPDEKPNQDTLT